MLYFYTLKNTAQCSRTGYLLLLQLRFPADVQGTRKEFKKSRAIDTVRGPQVGLSWRFVFTHRGFRDRIISGIHKSPDFETDLCFF